MRNVYIIYSYKDKVKRFWYDIQYTGRIHWDRFTSGMMRGHKNNKLYKLKVAK